MPAYLDLGLIAVVLLSALLSMVRGFTREVLAIVSWGAAAAAAYYLHPMVLPFVKPYIAKEQIALAVAAGLVFFVTLVIISIITVRISDAILDSKVGALDRTLGLLFGAARGFLLCVVGFIFFTWLLSGKPLPDWAANARSRPWLESAATQLRDMLPEDAAGNLLKFIKPPKGGAPEELTPDADAPDPKPAPPAAPPLPKKT